MNIQTRFRGLSFISNWRLQIKDLLAKAEQTMKAVLPLVFWLHLAGLIAADTNPSKVLSVGSNHASIQ